jgi:hypothetical protein
MGKNNQILVYLRDLKYGGDMFRRNVGLSPNYAALQPTRLHYLFFSFSFYILRDPEFRIVIEPYLSY